MNKLDNEMERFKRIMSMSEELKMSCATAEFLYDVFTVPFSKMVNKDLHPGIMSEYKKIKMSKVK